DAALVFNSAQKIAQTSKGSSETYEVAATDQTFTIEGINSAAAEGKEPEAVEFTLDVEAADYMDEVGIETLTFGVGMEGNDVIMVVSDGTKTIQMTKGWDGKAETLGAAIDNMIAGDGEENEELLTVLKKNLTMSGDVSVADSVIAPKYDITGPAEVEVTINNIFGVEDMQGNINGSATLKAKVDWNELYTKLEAADQEQFLKDLDAGAIKVGLEITGDTQDKMGFKIVVTGADDKVYRTKSDISLDDAAKEALLMKNDGEATLTVDSGIFAGSTILIKNAEGEGFDPKAAVNKSGAKQDVDLELTTAITGGVVTKESATVSGTTSVTNYSNSSNDPAEVSLANIFGTQYTTSSGAAVDNGTAEMAAYIDWDGLYKSLDTNGRTNFTATITNGFDVKLETLGANQNNMKLQVSIVSRAGTNPTLYTKEIELDAATREALKGSGGIANLDLNAIDSSVFKTGSNIVLKNADLSKLGYVPTATVNDTSGISNVAMGGAIFSSSSQTAYAASVANAGGVDNDGTVKIQSTGKLPGSTTLKTTEAESKAASGNADFDDYTTVAKTVNATESPTLTSGAIGGAAQTFTFTGAGNGGDLVLSVNASTAGFSSGNEALTFHLTLNAGSDPSNATYTLSYKLDGLTEVILADAWDGVNQTSLHSAINTFTAKGTDTTNDAIRSTLSGGALSISSGAGIGDISNSTAFADSRELASGDATFTFSDVNTAPNTALTITLDKSVQSNSNVTGTLTNLKIVQEAGEDITGGGGTPLYTLKATLDGADVDLVTGWNGTQSGLNSLLTSSLTYSALSGKLLLSSDISRADSTVFLEGQEFTPELQTITFSDINDLNSDTPIALRIGSGAGLDSDTYEALKGKTLSNFKIEIAPGQPGTATQLYSLKVDVDGKTYTLTDKWNGDSATLGAALREYASTPHNLGDGLDVDVANALGELGGDGHITMTGSITRVNSTAFKDALSGGGKTLNTDSITVADQIFGGTAGEGKLEIAFQNFDIAKVVEKLKANNNNDAAEKLLTALSSTPTMPKVSATIENDPDVSGKFKVTLSLEDTSGVELFSMGTIIIDPNDPNNSYKLTENGETVGERLSGKGSGWYTIEGADNLFEGLHFRITNSNKKANMGFTDSAGNTITAQNATDIVNTVSGLVNNAAAAASLPAGYTNTPPVEFTFSDIRTGGNATDVLKVEVTSGTALAADNPLVGQDLALSVKMTEGSEAGSERYTVTAKVGDKEYILTNDWDGTSANSITVDAETLFANTNEADIKVAEALLGLSFKGSNPINIAETNKAYNAANGVDLFQYAASSEKLNSKVLTVAEGLYGDGTTATEGQVQVRFKDFDLSSLVTNHADAAAIAAGLADPDNPLQIDAIVENQITDGVANGKFTITLRLTNNDGDEILQLGSFSSDELNLDIDGQSVDADGNVAEGISEDGGWVTINNGSPFDGLQVRVSNSNIRENRGYVNDTTDLNETSGGLVAQGMNAEAIESTPEMSEDVKFMTSTAGGAIAQTGGLGQARESGTVAVFNNTLEEGTGKVVTGVSGVTITEEGAQSIMYGNNTDGQGRIYVKF
ncbi:MAG: hypothetical protein LUG50_14225, partial [Planctomycetaceae bacterium]|nr:hypothetical protein [Planctomycetaceae bacterium]